MNAEPFTLASLNPNRAHWNSGHMRSFFLRLSLLTVWLTTSGLSFASDLDDVRKLINSGKYEEAEAFAAEQVERGVWNERWPKLLIQCQLAQGKYEPANEVYQTAIKRYPTSLSLRLLGVDVLRLCGLSDEAEAANNQILLLMQAAPSRYASRDNLVAMGNFFFRKGEDARQILELFYDRVRDSDPNHLGACLASAELAVSKNDFKVAAEILKRALEIAPDDPEVHYLLARAWESTDRGRANQSLNQALDLNPRHLPSLLLKAERAIDGEQYEAAKTILELIKSVNPNHQQAMALKAVLAHLNGDYELEKSLRNKALSTWTDNPQVDHLIGRKLSDKYRFEEAAAYQRKALELDSGFIPAKFHLAQDLLRLGNTEVGWTLAKQVADEDPYNVVAVNLSNLNQKLSNFEVLESDGILLRMSSDEAAIYGSMAMELLREAKTALCKKYRIEPDLPIMVEIFPEQKDFAIRTFGVPGGDGFLGVCFGRVITANSPASQGEFPSNWKSVLWHEFCHAVTLEKTKNRMPRWLSEGISVYEERQRDPSWGEKITPIYREMLLDDSLTPVSELSNAFLAPASPIHLQFAYFQSSLVVEFIIEQHGLDALLGILDDLADGYPISTALEKSVGSLARLDVMFSEHAKQTATAFGKDADWSREILPESPNIENLEQLLIEHPNHYWAHRSLAEKFVEQEKYGEAKRHLQLLEELSCFTGESGDPLALLAETNRQLGDVTGEKRALQTFVTLSSNALPALTRLIELFSEEKNWEEVLRYAGKILEIDPLRPIGHNALSLASENLNLPEKSLQALSSLSLMSPIDPALIQYQLAKAHFALEHHEEAKVHALLALADAPRYLEAHQLLLQILEQAPKPTVTSGSNRPSDPEADPSEIREPSGEESTTETTPQESNTNPTSNDN